MVGPNRRDMILAGAGGLTGLLSLSATGCSQPLVQGADTDIAVELPFKISLAQWSLHRALYGNNGRPPSLQPLDFPVVAKRDFGIDAVEYVNTFYRDQINDQSFIAELKNRAEGEGVYNHLIMCDDEGRLGASDPQARAAAVENHLKWLDMAATLGCRSIRVRPEGEGSSDEQMRQVAESLNALAEHGEARGLYVLVENHQGYSSNAEWLVGVLRLADHPSAGSLPDFGNFPIDTYDPYKGVRELMPFAQGISAKTFEFDEYGYETRLDYERLIAIVLGSGYRGYIGIEFEGQGVSEPAGIQLTRDLLVRAGSNWARANG